MLKILSDKVLIEVTSQHSCWLLGCLGQVVREWKFWIYKVFHFVNNPDWGQVDYAEGPFSTSDSQQRAVSTELDVLHARNLIILFNKVKIVQINDSDLLELVGSVV